MRSFELMEVSIGFINKDDLPVAEKDKDEDKTPAKPVFPDDMAERIVYMKERAHARLGLTNLIFDEPFSRYGDSDFARALLLTKSFDKKENLILSQLAVCNGALSKVDVKTKPKDKANDTKATADHN